MGFRAHDSITKPSLDVSPPGPPTETGPESNAVYTCTPYLRPSRPRWVDRQLTGRFGPYRLSSLSPSPLSWTLKLEQPRRQSRQPRVLGTLTRTGGIATTTQSQQVECMTCQLNASAHAASLPALQSFADMSRLLQLHLPCPALPVLACGRESGL